jgi:hypothetical protein
MNNNKAITPVNVTTYVLCVIIAKEAKRQIANFTEGVLKGVPKQRQITNHNFAFRF